MTSPHRPDQPPCLPAGVCDDCAGPGGPERGEARPGPAGPDRAWGGPSRISWTEPGAARFRPAGKTWPVPLQAALPWGGAVPHRARPGPGARDEGRPPSASPGLILWVTRPSLWMAAARRSVSPGQLVDNRPSTIVSSAALSDTVLTGAVLTRAVLTGAALTGAAASRGARLSRGHASEWWSHR